MEIYWTKGHWDSTDGLDGYVKLISKYTNKEYFSLVFRIEKPYFDNIGKTKDFTYDLLYYRHVFMDRNLDCPRTTIIGLLQSKDWCCKQLKKDIDILTEEKETEQKKIEFLCAFNPS